VHYVLLRYVNFQKISIVPIVTKTVMLLSSAIVICKCSTHPVCYLLPLVVRIKRVFQEWQN